MGYNNAHVVDFEKMTLAEQLRTAYCTDIMLGVQGQGLQW